jgi:hypothetical protein
MESCKGWGKFGPTLQPLLHIYCCMRSQEAEKQLKMCSILHESCTADALMSLVELYHKLQGHKCRIQYSGFLSQSNLLFTTTITSPQNSTTHPTDHPPHPFSKPSTVRTMSVHFYYLLLYSVSDI